MPKVEELALDSGPMVYPSCQGGGQSYKELHSWDVKCVCETLLLGASVCSEK